MQGAARRRTGFIVAGVLVTSVIFIGLGWGGVASIAAVLALTSVATQIGHARKARLGLGEPPGGRDARQVFANIGCAAAFAVVSLRVHAFALASIAALAEAAADTCQSEIGEVASRRAWSITSLREVAPGTDGGVTVAGTLTGLVAAVAIAAVAAITRVVPPREIGIAAMAAFLGTIIDSVLGATLERRGWVGNDGVNFMSTLAAGIIAVCIIR